MALTASRALARGLIGVASLGVAGTAAAGDQVVAAVLGAGAGAIIGHSIGGPDAAVVGGIIGAAAGAAVGASHRKVHYRGHYGYAPPAYYPAPPRGPVFVMPPPAIVFVPGHDHGYWHHGFDDWGRPFRSWVPAPGHRRHYAPPPHPHYRPHGPGYGHRW